MVIKQLNDMPKEVPAMPGTRGVTLQWLITKKDGALHYAMRVFTIAAGGEIPVHSHDDIEHEIFVVEGEAVMKLDGEERVVRTGDALLINIGDRHGFLNRSDKPFRFVCVIPL